MRKCKKWHSLPKYAMTCRIGTAQVSGDSSLQQTKVVNASVPNSNWNRQIELSRHSSNGSSKWLLTDRCELMNKSLVQKAYAVIIRFEPDEGCKLLVLETKSTDYEFYRLPGGNVEADETPLQAAFRETHEESGTENIRFIRKIGTTTYFKPFIQSDVKRTDYLFEADSDLPDEWEWIGTVGSEAGAVFAFSWISHSSIDRVDPELRTFLTPDHIPELFGLRWNPEMPEAAND